MKNRFLSLLIIAIFAITLSVNAQPGNRINQSENVSPEQKERVKKDRVEALKSRHQNFFTEEQKEAVQKIHLETAKATKPLKNELRELAAHQKTLTTADKADLKAINKNIDKMSEVKADLAKIMAKQHQEIRSLLNEEQLLRFDAMRGNIEKEKNGDLRKRSSRDERRLRDGQRI